MPHDAADHCLVSSAELSQHNHHNSMGKPLDIAPSEGWTGAFTWDACFMRIHVCTVKHDYHPTDPRT
jgi:hypothetical protein